MGKLPNYKVFLVICLGFITGVGLRSFAPLGTAVVYGVIIVGLCGMLFGHSRSTVWIAGVCILACAAGIVRYELSIPRVGNHDIQAYNGREVRFRGTVSVEPDIRQDTVKLTLSASQGLEGLPAQVRGKVLVTVPRYPAYEYGSLVECSCVLKTPEPIVTDVGNGQRTFRYDQYLARYGIYSLCIKSEVVETGRRYGNPVMHAMLSVKAGFVRAVQQSLPEPHASFLAGLVLGAKRAIPDELMQSFSRTGTTHIVALSGYNITIIAVMIMNVCKRLLIPRKKAFWVSLGAIGFFVAITGAQASVVRAAVMGMLVLLATQAGRMSRVTNSLVFAAVAMLMWNPRILAFDAGFQLSFLATVGLVYASPHIERLFRWMPNPFEFRANLVATLSATMMTLPLIMYQFGRMSVVAPLVNVLILPMVPLAMAFGFIAGVCAIVWVPLGQAVGWVVWLVLGYILFIVRTFAQFSFSSIDSLRIQTSLLAILYCVLFGTLLVLSRRKKRASLPV
ncbi:MAG: ComEC/Rec2 family competence protein [Patescibacteria group bacterium]|nr:ComEC/Rec2 family competence protein [Patescibacteria group bacterium]MDD5715693.1 ComEC/Rec2 family competence protein [Patescibacteria group bacterium]